MALGQVPCGCGGRNPTCYRCDGCGFTTREPTQSWNTQGCRESGTELPRPATRSETREWGGYCGPTQRKTKCPHCGKTVRKIGLTDHVRAKHPNAT